MGGCCSKTDGQQPKDREKGYSQDVFRAPQPSDQPVPANTPAGPGNGAAVVFNPPPPGGRRGPDVDVGLGAIVNEGRIETPRPMSARNSGRNPEFITGRMQCTSCGAFHQVKATQTGEENLFCRSCMQVERHRYVPPIVPIQPTQPLSPMPAPPCPGCGEPIIDGDCSVFSCNRNWHRDCLVLCLVCNKPIVNRGGSMTDKARQEMMHPECRELRAQKGQSPTAGGGDKDVQSFLEALSLKHLYGDAFARNKTTMSSLCKMSLDDIGALGVHSAGHRQLIFESAKHFASS